MIAFVIGAFAIAASAVPATHSAQPPGEIRGIARATMDGYRLSCHGALLIPHSAQAEERIKAYFGDVERAEKTVSYGELARRRASGETALTGSREENCAGRGGFRFSGVAPGSYFVVATLAYGSRPVAGGSGEGDRPGRALDLMRKIEVAPAKSVRLELDSAKRSSRQD